MITASYSINAGRLAAVDFAGPYMVTHQGLLIEADTGITGLADVKDGMRLCSVSGSTPAQKVKEALPGVQLQEFDTYAACAEGVKQGVVDALTTDATILAGFADSGTRNATTTTSASSNCRIRTAPSGRTSTTASACPRATALTARRSTRRWRRCTTPGHSRRSSRTTSGTDFEIGPKPDIGDLSFTED
jgi:glutamate transport system substrate-binding protein